MLKKINMDSSKIFDATGEDVVYELFHSMIREVRDEV